jgi:2-C-methyl-D-erythritol 4-phosphate cytidylyltransferase
VAVHDGARPFVTAELIDACVRAADRSGAAIAAVPIADTLKQAEAGVIVRTVPRTGMWAAQTPQVARTALLREAFANAGELEITDEASLMESRGVPVIIVPGSARNLKITTADDLVLAEALVSASAVMQQP